MAVTLGVMLLPVRVAEHGGCEGLSGRHVSAGGADVGQKCRALPSWWPANHDRLDSNTVNAASALCRSQQAVLCHTASIVHPHTMDACAVQAHTEADKHAQHKHTCATLPCRTVWVVHPALGRVHVEAGPVGVHHHL